MAKYHCTDHAIARWLERQAGITKREIEAQLITPEIRAAIDAGCTKITTNGWQYILNPERRAIVTLYPEGIRIKPKRAGSMVK